MTPVKMTILGLLLNLPFTIFAQQAVKFEKNYIEVCFSNKLNIHDLSQIQTTLSEKGINLNYDDLKFAKDGKLTTIEYHVMQDKFGAADKNYGPEFEIGFIINTGSTAKYDIIAGTKKQIETRRAELEKKN